MPEKTGFDLLTELNACPHVIFVSAYDEYALKAFEVNALDYLLKPVDPERLSETIQKLEKKVENNDTPTEDHLSVNDQIFIKDGEVVDKSVGASPKNILEEKIEAML